MERVQEMTFSDGGTTYWRCHGMSFEDFSKSGMPISAVIYGEFCTEEAGRSGSSSKSHMK